MSTIESTRAPRSTRVIRTAASVAIAALVATSVACSAGGADTEASSSKSVTLLVHDSFHLPDEAKAAFSKKTGLTLKVVAGDSGQQLISKLKLTKDAPVADAVYGFTATTSGELAGADIIADAKIALPKGARDLALADLPGAIPVDTGDMCVNIDTTYFRAKGLPEPETLDDLIKPAYRGLMVTPDPAAGDTGLAFLYATIAAKGTKGWQDYWRALQANGLKIVRGWSEAYEQEFTQGGGKGKYPIVVSYATSPAATVSDDGTSATSKALPQTCFAQTEYAGVLEGAKNPDGAKAVIEWLVSPEVQRAIPESMYMYPVLAGVELPRTWKAFAPKPDPADVLSLDPADIRAHREAWLRAFADITRS